MDRAFTFPELPAASLLSPSPQPVIEFFSHHLTYNILVQCTIVSLFRTTLAQIHRNKFD